MNIKIKKFSTDEQKLYQQVANIRIKVFVEEQCVSRELEFDEFEKESVHYLLLYDTLPVATARWRRTTEGVKLERFAVLASHRHTGLGYLILKEILADVMLFGTRIYLHAQVDAAPFYEKHGFTRVGERFVEADIEHYKMVYR